jgi:hypothetical protein
MDQYGGSPIHEADNQPFLGDPGADYGKMAVKDAQDQDLTAREHLQALYDRVNLITARAVDKDEMSALKLTLPHIQDSSIRLLTHNDLQQTHETAEVAHATAEAARASTIQGNENIAQLTEAQQQLSESHREALQGLTAAQQAAEVAAQQQVAQLQAAQQAVQQAAQQQGTHLQGVQQQGTQLDQKITDAQKRAKVAHDKVVQLQAELQQQSRETVLMYGKIQESNKEAELAAERANTRAGSVLSQVSQYDDKLQAHNIKLAEHSKSHKDTDLILTGTNDDGILQVVDALKKANTYLQEKVQGHVTQLATLDATIVSKVQAGLQNIKQELKDEILAMPIEIRGGGKKQRKSSYRRRRSRKR